MIADPFADCPLERVEWVDSQLTFSAWTHLDEIEPEKPVVGRMATAGWVIRENDEAILIAGSLGGIDGGTSPQISEAVTIPKVAIIRRELLKACHTKPKRSRRGR